MISVAAVALFAASLFGGTAYAIRCFNRQTPLPERS
jgi:hypothetical protein